MFFKGFIYVCLRLSDRSCIFLRRPQTTPESTSAERMVAQALAKPPSTSLLPPRQSVSTPHSIRAFSVSGAFSSHGQAYKIHHTFSPQPTPKLQNGMSLQTATSWLMRMGLKSKLLMKSLTRHQCSSFCTWLLLVKVFLSHFKERKNDVSMMCFLADNEKIKRSR